jgi:Carboxypeptidase regulatory-like domain
VERVTAAQLTLAIAFCATSAGACTAIAPKNPVKAGELCGRTQDPTGSPISDFDLRLVGESQDVVAEVHTDAKGNFRFPPVIKGTYYMTTTSGGWQLGAAVKVTSAKESAKCRHPLIVQPTLGGCGGGITKKGYRPKY